MDIKQIRPGVPGGGTMSWWMGSCLRSFCLALIFCAVAVTLRGIEIKRPVETDFVTLRAMSFDEAKELLEPFLSPDGTLGFARTRRLLVIHDYPENIRTIKKILEKTDSDPVNIRIQVSFHEVGRSRHGGVAVEIEGDNYQLGPDIHGRRRPGTYRRPVHGSAGRPIRRSGFQGTFGDVTVSGALGGGSMRDFTSQSVLAGNGREARIWVGETVYDPVWVREYGCRHGWWDRDFVETDLGASLWVRPRLRPDGTIDIEIYPKIVTRGRSGHRSVAVKELSTHIVAANGQTVSIGGLDKDKRRGYAELLGVGRIFNGSALNITLTPTVMRPRKAPPRRQPGKAAPAVTPASRPGGVESPNGSAKRSGRP